MTTAFRTIPVELADAVRALLPDPPVGPRDDDSALLDEWGVFLPVERVEATGRAHCRQCSGDIAKGTTAVRFEIDFYLRQFGRWGNKTTAYLHEECPDDQKGSTNG